ncbi:hypothetical protein JTE90_027334 [Oedothorax gibbosus]|uniref:Solute carrier family 10 member 6 n=1 Tax=Oedothorax gibbosus TaxID=931172 RepID=A0AAV6VYS0_9ARAC|nr:hypothetical protein JTE90_027334 [Oedothorax gibbosus]
MAAKIIPNTDNFTTENSSCQMSNITVTLENAFPLELLKPIMDILMLILSVIVMLCIGCEVHWQKLKEHVKHPTCIGIILVCQLFIIPLMAYTLMRSSSVDRLYATEILIISCCPGGLLTNAFTYFCEGDLALSATMTSISTLISFGAIPLNLWIYGRNYATENLILPYSELSLAFATVLLLVIIGGKYIGLLNPDYLYHDRGHYRC